MSPIDQNEFVEWIRSARADEFAEWSDPVNHLPKSRKAPAKGCYINSDHDGAPLSNPLFFEVQFLRASSLGWLATIKNSGCLHKSLKPPVKDSCSKGDGDTIISYIHEV